MDATADATGPMKIVTIIPFFQREQGLLAASISTALEQRGDFKNTIIVVDDGCPFVSARQELLDADLLDRPDIILYEKPTNGGVGSAKNYALDRLPENTEAVAVLDPDDFWPENHLRTAVTAMRLGFGMYFSNYQRAEWPEDKWASVGFKPEEFPAVGRGTNLRVYNRNLAYDVYSFHLIQSSTHVVARHYYDHLRFLENAPLLQDDTMYVRIFRAGAKVCFSENPPVMLGKGVNVSVAPDWGTLRSFRKCATILGSWDQVTEVVDFDDRLSKLRHDRKSGLKKEMARHVFLGHLGSDIFKPDVVRQFRAILGGAFLIARDRILK